MIQKDKNLQAKQNVQKIILRAGHLKQTIRSMFDYIVFTQQSYRSYSKNVFRNLTAFETQISKNCRYQPDKTNMILRLSKQYRELPSKIQNDSEVNLNKIPLISKSQQLNKEELQLKKKSQTFHQEFKNYSNTISQYNLIYQTYLDYCKDLDEIILKFKSYSDPLKFYDKSITSQYQQKLQYSLHISKNQQTKVATELQLLDSKRKFLDELIKQIRQLFTHLFHNCLKSIETLTALLSDPTKTSNTPLENNQDKYIESVNESEKHSQIYDLEFGRLNTFTSNIDEGNELMSDFNDFLKDKKSKKFNEPIVADHKLFSLRCQNIKNKKQKAFLESLNLQECLLDAFEQQIKNYKEFQKSFKQKEKNLFGPSGKESYKKDVQLLFGFQANKLHEFIMIIIESPKIAFEQINVWLTDNFVNFKQVIVSKKQSLAKFNKFYDEIMSEHLKQKTKFEHSDPSDTEVSQTYRLNLVSSYDQFKLIFSELQARQLEKDKVVNEKLTLMFKFITKQHTSCQVQNLTQRHKQKVQTLRKFKIISEAMTVFKSDPIYNILYEEFFSMSLQKNFESKINKREYEEAEAILKQKSKIAKKMLKRQIGCCGLIKASPIDSEIYSTHKCYIYNHQKDCPFGKLKVLKDGLIFEEIKWNPFAEKVYILIPKSDVQSIESKSLTYNQCYPEITEGVCLNTQKGPLVLFSKQFDDLFNALQKIYGETYRKSLALDKKGMTRMDSTESGGQGRASIMVSYNKDQKTFVQEPVCLNPALSRMSSSGQIDKKLKGSNIRKSAVSAASQEYKSNNRSRVRSKSQMKQELAVRAMYEQLMVHYEKHQFLSQKFSFVNKTYKSPERKDFEFYDKETHNHFLLKQLKKHQIIDTTAGIELEITYEWKVAYPTNSSLHSFKHGQKIQININSNPPTIMITEWPHIKNQIFNRHFFYQSIKVMNDHIWKYITQNTNMQFLYEPGVEKEFDMGDNSEQIFIDDIKELGGSFPEELEIKQSRMMAVSNDLRVPTSGEQLDLKASNARSMVSVRQAGRDFKRSSIRESAQGLLKPGQF